MSIFRCARDPRLRKEERRIEAGGSARERERARARESDLICAGVEYVRAKRKCV